MASSKATTDRCTTVSTAVQMIAKINIGVRITTAKAFTARTTCTTVLILTTTKQPAKWARKSWTKSSCHDCTSTSNEHVHDEDVDKFYDPNASYESLINQKLEELNLKMGRGPGDVD